MASRRNRASGTTSPAQREAPVRVNADKPHLWKADIAASVDQFNDWFMRFAPEAFRSSRVRATEEVRAALIATRDLRSLDVRTLKENPSALSTLRMCTAPPLAVDRLIGLADANKSLIKQMGKGKLAVRMKAERVEANLERVCNVLTRLIDTDIFPWLGASSSPTNQERDRASTIVADRLSGATANPVIRNAQEDRQFQLLGEWLGERGYRRQSPAAGAVIGDMEAGTYSFRTILMAGESRTIKMPIDAVIQPKRPRDGAVPVLIEAKSAGDFANTNKRRKEEATKIRQLQAAHGDDVSLVLFLCGYFGSEYLGYEAAEGLDWVWEHRIDDLKKLGL